MSTQKVFISGSIAVKKLDNEVLSSLQKMMQNGLQILLWRNTHIFIQQLTLSL